MILVRVNRRAADRVASGHPWIFSSDVVDASAAAAGDVVQVVDPSGRPLGTAHYSSSSQISLRLLDTNPVEAGRDFYLRRLSRAASYRERVVSDSEAYRVVHGEADLLPGLVIDRYGDYLAVQFLSQGVDRAQQAILDCLGELFRPRGIAVRNDAAARRRESLPLETRVGSGEVPPRICFRMNGLAWHADLLEGQKTGVFLDQRENYLAATRYGRGHALDCFSSSGGFALHLAPACDSVEAADSSAPALALAALNREANAIANVQFRQADVFDLLAGYANARRRFDTIVLDPPAFAKSRTARDSALRGYREINRRALQILSPDGILVSCSCSHHVSEAALLEAIAQASLDTGRALRVVERRSQARDHPILLTVPETHYLKCLILQVVS